MTCMLITSVSWKDVSDGAPIRRWVDVATVQTHTLIQRFPIFDTVSSGILYIGCIPHLFVSWQPLLLLPYALDSKTSM